MTSALASGSAAPAMPRDRATDLAGRMAELATLSMPDVRLRYIEVFGERPNSHNRLYLVRRIAWRLQEQAYGGLTERARQRAEELACDADLRSSPPRPMEDDAPAPVTASLPEAIKPASRLAPGRLLTRDYNGKRYEVKVVERGYEYAGEVYTSLSAIANRITGSHWSGNAFFGLRKASRA